MRISSFPCLFVALLVSATHVHAQSAICVLVGTLGNEEVSGTISFVEDELTYDISLLTGTNTLEFHQAGVLHSTDGSALGPSFSSIAVGSGGVATVDSNFTLSGEDSIVGRGVSLQSDSGARIAQCVIGRGDAMAEPADNIMEADCIFQSTSSQVDESLQSVPTGLESGFARFFQRDNGLDVEIWASGFSTDALYPFGVAETGNLTLGSSPRDIFMGDPSAIVGGTRTLVGQLSLGINTPPGLRVNTRFGSWAFPDPFSSLNGVNSIVGRSLVIFDKTCNRNITGDAECMALAQCVVGIVPTSTPDLDAIGVQRAHSLMDPTPMTLDNPRNMIVVGTVDFVTSGTDVTVRYFFTGLEPGPHTWHIHRLGDISSEDGSSLMGHFIGDCSDDFPCREREVRDEDEPPVLQEVGAIEGNAPIVANSRGFAYGEFDDPVITLNGMRSVVGRGIIVHALEPAIRVSQGVIGRVREVSSPDTPESPEVFAAICVLQPTGRDFAFDASGYIQFDKPRNGNMSVTYSISDANSMNELDALLPWGIYDYGFLLSVQDGISVGERFEGNVNMRDGDPTAIGAINDGQLLNMTDRIASGDFVDSALTFSGQDSIVGRSVVVKDAANVNVVAMCTIGIQEELEDQGRLIDRTPGVSAVCTLQPTRLNPNQELTGSMTFTQSLTDVEISYNIQGLTDGAHGLHVHTLGSLHSTDASVTGPHFPGDCSDDTPCRPLNATEQTLGWIGNGFEIVSSNNIAMGVFTDDVIEFSGVNSIIGRAIVVHGDGIDSGVRVAQCVIGRNNMADEFEVEEASNSAGVTEADCIFRSTNVNTRTSGDETGHARFFENTQNGGVDVEVWADGFVNSGEHPLEIREIGNVGSPGAPGDLFLADMQGENALQSTNGFGARTFSYPSLSLNGVNSIVGRTFSIRSSVQEVNLERAVVAQCVIGIARENDLPGGVLQLSVDLTTQAEITGGIDLLVASTGSGRAMITYDPNTRLLSWLIFTTGLTSDLVQLHFHGPANRLMPGALQINATNIAPPSLGESGSFVLTEAQARDLVNGLWYINVHTVLNPSGELRGQIAPRDVEFTVDLTVEAEITGGVILNEPSTGSGVAQITYNPIEGRLTWDIGLTEPTLSNLVQLHFHGPATRFVGGALQVNATALGMTLNGTTLIGPDQGMDLLLGLWYINVHTIQNPSGELRGQIAPPVGVFRAHSVMTPAAQSPLNNNVVRGTVDFVREDGASDITVRYFFTGLAPGNHTWHIHQFGDITSPNGTAVMGHFIGDCGAAMPCRPPSSLQEVGAIEDSIPIIADANGNSYDVFTDSVIDFSGIDSIIGRGIIIHDIDPAFRVSQGVIGIAGENAPAVEIMGVVNLSPEAVIELDVESMGTGRIEVVFNPNTNELSWNLAFSNLTSGNQAIRAAFHGPADRSEEGIEQVVIEDMLFTSPSMGMVTISDSQGADVVNGLWYMLVSTDQNPDGELRGQVADELPLLEITVPLTTEQEIAGGILPMVNSMGSGSAEIFYNPNTLVLRYNFMLEGLTSDVEQLHFHGPAGRLETGSLTANVTDQGLQGQFRLASDAESTAILDGLWYINIHTVLNPSGELRGQIAEALPLFSNSLTELTIEAVELGEQSLVSQPTLTTAEFLAFYDPNIGEFAWTLTIPNAGEGVTATFHAPATESQTAGVIGSVPITLRPNNGNLISIEEVTLNQAMNDRLLAGQWYVLVSTLENPNGELRVQVLLEEENAGETDRPVAQEQEPTFPTAIREAVCVITPTFLDNRVDATGWVRFSRAANANAMNVSYRIEQLQVGVHPWSVNQFGNLLSYQDGLSTGGIFFGNVDRPAAAADFAGAIGDVGDGDGSVIRVVGATGQDGVAERFFLDEFLQFAGPNSIIGRSVVIQDVNGMEREAHCTIGIAAEGDIIPPVVPVVPTPAPDNVEETTAPAVSPPDPTAVVDDVARSSQLFPEWTVHLITTLVIIATLVMH